MKEYDSFYTWLTETQLYNDTPIRPDYKGFIGEDVRTVGAFARRVKADKRFPRNSHRKQYHINYMLRAWSDMGLEGVGEDAIHVIWPMYLKAVTPCYNCPQSPEHLAWLQHLRNKGLNVDCRYAELSKK